jgi:hypothetical protein
MNVQGLIPTSHAYGGDGPCILAGLIPLLRLARCDPVARRIHTMRIFALAALATLLSVSSHAAIPLLGPCDPDFRSGASCSPGNAKEERPAAPATSVKPPKSSAPATSAPAPIKSAPAAKSPSDNRPETTTQVSLPAEESCPKSPHQRVESADETGPLVIVSLSVGP